MSILDHILTSSSPRTTCGKFYPASEIKTMVKGCATFL
jgi:hypothetical protein